MLLKSIELRGFKSFADKTELNFKKGVTAVVGPNGSGKSNISDAVRWVLGEQSAKSLRGGKMEDVIFAGTQYRKPVGLAQVSLTLDNSEGKLPIDYNEVIITRRIFRSGESEYLINNSTCRLKDVNELFMDTGIGKEGYSIIGQGKIDAILSGKPDDRRSLLEEAAGIVKYKSRKEEAERKLQNTEQNLLRIQDILSTYEERLDPLRIESDKAKEFVEISNELNALEISYIVDTLDKLKVSISSEQEKIQRVMDINSELQEERALNKQQLEEKNLQLEKHEAENNTTKNKYYDDKNKAQELEYQVKILKEKNLFIEENIVKNQGLISEIQKMTEGSLSQRKLLEDELDLNEKKQLSIDSSINELESKVIQLNEDISSKEALIEALRTEAIELLRKSSDLSNRKSLLENNLDKNTSKLQELQSQSTNFKNLSTINLNTIASLNESIEKLQREIVVLNEDIEAYKATLKENRSLRQRIENQLKVENIKHSKLEATSAMLSNLENQYEGYTKAVKNLFVHCEKGKLGISKEDIYLLGDIIKVDKRFETCMEIALSSAISNIITNDEHSAKTLINYLKSNSLGRATFLPLSIIKGKKALIGREISQLPGYMGIASDLIHYDEKFHNAILYVLGRTLICHDMNSALLVAKKTNFSYKIVTLDGEVVNVGGALTGGSTFHKNTSIISRKREIEETLQGLNESNKKINTLANELKKIEYEYKHTEELMQSAKDKTHLKLIDITKLKEKISSVEVEILRVKESLRTADREISSINNENEQISISISELDSQISSSVNDEGENRLSIGRIDEDLTNKREEINNLKQQLTELKVNKAQVDEIVSGKNNELTRIVSEYDANISKIKHYEAEIISSTKNKEKNHSSILSCNDEIIKLEQTLMSMENEFQSYESLRLQLKEEIKKIETSLDNFNLMIQNNEDKIHKLELAKARIELEQDSVLNRLNEEMNLTYAEALEKSVALDNLEEAKKNIRRLKDRISLLGTVNVGAIEEYKEISEKFSFMTAQQKDLIDAKNELINVINEMTAKMRTIFLENFKILRNNFNETFKELFKGGSADLILTEGDELTANIDINVQPPGKKLQNINLMSGGEKVLSAIALLFAILKMKPSPFCILDEIEAALDDANVYRYADFMKKFSEKVQFIVITHRKGTMEASDVLYGVTMEEKGISKIISLDMSKR